MSKYATLLAATALLVGALPCLADSITDKKMQPIHTNVPQGAGGVGKCCHGRLHEVLWQWVTYCPGALLGKHDCCCQKFTPCCYPALYTFFLCDDYAGCVHGNCGGGFNGSCAVGNGCASCTKYR